MTSKANTASIFEVRDFKENMPEQIYLKKQNEQEARTMNMTDICSYGYPGFGEVSVVIFIYRDPDDDDSQQS